MKGSKRGYRNRTAYGAPSDLDNAYEELAVKGIGRGSGYTSNQNTKQKQKEENAI